MGQIVHGFIEHRLMMEEILKLPEKLIRISNDSLAGQWHWTVQNMDKEVLTQNWKRKAEYFINNSWTEADLNQLKSNNSTFHFISPYLLTFDNLLRWDVYHRNLQSRKEFDLLVKAIATLINAVDLLIVPDLSSVSFFNEEEDTTVDTYRKKANGNEMYAIELY